MGRTGRWLCAHSDPAGLWQHSGMIAWKSLGMAGHQTNTSVELPEWLPGASRDPTLVSQRALNPILSPQVLVMALQLSPGGCAGL